MAFPNAYEQLLIELVNRARLDPLAEAARYGIDLNEDLPPGTISGDPKQPLAWDGDLIEAARAHSDWMLQEDTFSHTGENGSSPSDRAAAAGYSLQPPWSVGENIAWRGTTGTYDTESYILLHHEGLFLSEGHRENMLESDFREVGVGSRDGEFTDDGTSYTNTLMTTELFAYSGDDFFVTGVVFDDQDGDDFYSPGEGRGGVDVALAGAGATSSSSSGGYNLALGPGSYTLTFSGGGLGAPVGTSVVFEDANVKVDLVDGDTIQSSASTTLGSNAVGVRLLGSGALSAWGNALGNQMVGNRGANSLHGEGGADVLDGAAGNDTLLGGSGADTLTGGAGTDAASYAGAASGVIVRLDTGLGYTGEAAGDSLSSFESLIGSAHADVLIGNAVGNGLAGGAGADDLRGQGGADTLTGGADSDTLEGGSGADRLDGGAGFDTAAYTTASSGVIARIDSGLGYTGDANGDRLTSIENLTGSDHGDTLIGNFILNVLNGRGGDDDLRGQDGDDTLMGGAGADTLDGGSGTDAAAYASAASGVIVRLDTGVGYTGEAAGDRLSSVESLLGSAHADVLIGNAVGNGLEGGAGADDLRGQGGVDTLTGGADSDTLEGGSGADRLDGGAGFDTAAYTTASSGVIVRIDSGLGYTGDANGDRLTSIENLTGSNHGDTLIGNFILNVLSGRGGDDDLRGQDGDDTLMGGTGGDTLTGGTGTDAASYADAASGVIVRLDAGLGYTGEAAGDTLSSIEDLIGSAHADILIGNAGGNGLAGSAGADDLRGQAGNDTLLGGTGADVLNGGVGVDAASYAGGSSGVIVRLDAGLGYSGEAAGDTLVAIESLVGSAHADILIGDGGGNGIEGGAGNDDLRGQAGADTLAGGLGNDTLSGGSGNDRFVFGDGTGQDRIADFSGGSGIGDVIDLTGNGSLNTFAEVQAAADQAGAHTVIDLGGGNTVTLENFTAANLAADDFVF